MTIKKAIDILEKNVICMEHYKNNTCPPNYPLCWECEYFTDGKNLYTALYDVLPILKEVVNK